MTTNNQNNQDDNLTLFDDIVPSSPQLPDDKDNANQQTININDGNAQDNKKQVVVPVMPLV